MKRSQQARWRNIPLDLALITLMGVGSTGMTACSRQFAIPGSSETANRSQLPFDRVSDRGGISPTDGFAADGIPAGTELTIRLQIPLSSADSRAGDSFQAVLDEPLIVGGTTLVPRGSPITGSVTAAKPSRGLHDLGFLRLTLASIAMNGKSIPIQTSSIFAKGASYQRRKGLAMPGSEADAKAALLESEANSNNEIGASSYPRDSYPGHGNVKFSTGHRLTFRLAQPLRVSGSSG
jgi:hypothetical protein